MLNEGNQIHNFISSSGSGTVINYGSGTVPFRDRIRACVADKHHLDADPEPSSQFDADPDPPFHFEVDPDPAHQRIQVMRICDC